MPMTTTVQPLPVSDAELAELAKEVEKSVEEVRTTLQGILAESVLQSFPADQRGPIAVGIFRSRAMNEILDGGEPFHIYVLQTAGPEHIKPKEGDPFHLCSVFGIGYSKHGDGTDGPVGVMELGIFIRKDSPSHMKDLWKQFVVGKTYEANFTRKGTDPQPGQRQYYSVSATPNTKPKEIPTPAGIDAPAFVKSVFPACSVDDLPRKATTDADDINTWVSCEAAVISARRGVQKKTQRPYGFFEVIAPGTKVADLKKNPNAKATIKVNAPQVQWTVGSRLLFFGPVQPPSDDGQYPAALRARNMVTIIGIPYVQAVEAPKGSNSATKSGATEDAADVADF